MRSRVEHRGGCDLQAIHNRLCLSSLYNANVQKNKRGLFMLTLKKLKEESYININDMETLFSGKAVIVVENGEVIIKNLKNLGYLLINLIDLNLD